MRKYAENVMNVMRENAHINFHSFGFSIFLFLRIEKGETFLPMKKITVNAEKNFPIFNPNNKIISIILFS